MQLGELQFGELPHFFNTPHAFKKIGEMQYGEMPHTRLEGILENVKYMKNKVLYALTHIIIYLI
ncbi:hypothetical protein H8356DRAFT_1623850 [Neocallimastix lanati (nom. inval.)]|nr:hypothetical protein H8356DRAFT_1623850 [Neocallimastix sp. JGI-2020a]